MGNDQTAGSIVHDLAGIFLNTGQSPTAPDNDPLEKFLKALHSTTAEKLIVAKAEALRPVFEAMAEAFRKADASAFERAATGHIAESMRKEIRDLAANKEEITAEDLYNLYIKISFGWAVIELDRPIVVSSNLVFDDADLRSPDNIERNRCGPFQSEPFQESIFVYPAAKAEEQARKQITYDSSPMYSGTGWTILRIDEINRHNGQPYPMVLALPTVVLEDDVLNTIVADFDNGEPLLRSMQEVVQMLNHNYLHLFTASQPEPYRMIKPVDQTPLGLIFGLAVDPERGVIDPSDSQGFKSSGFIVEIYTADKLTRTNYHTRNTYEFHILHFHKYIMNMNSEASRKLQSSLHTSLEQFCKHLTKIHELLSAKDKNSADKLAFYMLTTIYGHLLRIGPRSHKLLQSFEERINTIGLDTENLIPLLPPVDRENPTFCEAVKMSEIESTEPADLHGKSAAELVALAAHYSQAGDLLALHEPKYENATNAAPVDMRDLFRCLQEDMDRFDNHGGMARYYDEMRRTHS